MVECVVFVVCKMMVEYYVFVWFDDMFEIQIEIILMCGIFLVFM